MTSKIMWVSRDKKELFLPRDICIWNEKPILDTDETFIEANDASLPEEITYKKFRSFCAFTLKKGECIKVKEIRRLVKVK